MNKKILIAVCCIITAAVIIAVLYFFGLYHMPIGCNSIEFAVGCARVNEIGEMKWTEGDSSFILPSDDSSWKLHEVVKLLNSLKLNKASELPTDIQVVKITFMHRDFVKFKKLEYMYVAYDFYTKKVYANKNNSWYMMGENEELNRLISEQMDTVWFGLGWRGQSTYCPEEFPESDFENATFRYDLYWKKSDYPNATENGLRLSDFNNIDEAVINSREDAILRAAKELGYDNPVGVTFYDETCGYYMVELANDNGNGIVKITDGVIELIEPIFTVIMDDMGRTVEVYEGFTRTRPFWP